MSIIITGPTGDVGLGLTKKLLNVGKRPILVTKRPDLLRMMLAKYKLPDNLFKQNCLDSPEILTKEIGKSKIFYHLAAAMGDGYDFAYILLTNGLNVIKLIKVIESINPLLTFIFISSQRSYDALAIGEDIRSLADNVINRYLEHLGCKEVLSESYFADLQQKLMTHVLPIYSFSKYLVERYLENYSILKNWCVFRVFNMVGEGLHSGRIIEKMIHSVLYSYNLPFTNEQRDFVYVVDVINILKNMFSDHNCFRNKYSREIIDICSGRLYSLEEIYSNIPLLFKKILHDDSTPITFNEISSKYLPGKIIHDIMGKSGSTFTDFSIALERQVKYMIKRIHSIGENI